MRTVCGSVPSHVVQLVQNLRGQLRDPHFQNRHRARAEDFTRLRRLSFPVMMLLVLQKTVKSIQRHLHEFLRELSADGVFEPPTAGAFTHARAKLKHTAFIELNQTMVLPMAYGPEGAPGLHLWKGHRLLGVDSSLIRLPNSPSLRKEFGVVEVANQNGSTGTAYPGGRISVLYDLLNRMALDSRLETSRRGEVDMAIEQLGCAQPGDVLVSDRGFAGYLYLAWHQHLRLHYVVRCPARSFAAAQEMFAKNLAGQSRVVWLRPAFEAQAEAKRLGLPLELSVRFVSVRLPGGQLEVLATSLLDEAAYPTEEMAGLYAKRWGHETFYGLVKGRLDLENFSGQTPEAVRQDFFAAMLLCNLESVLTGAAQQELDQKRAASQPRQQVNRAVSCHAIKERMLNLLLGELPAEEVIGQLQRMFLAAPVTVRPERKPPRRTPSPSRSCHYLRRIKKNVF